MNIEMSKGTNFQLREFKNAILYNKLDKVREMIMNGFSPNTILHEPSRKRGLHVAAKAGNDDMVKLLIGFGAVSYNIGTYPDKQDPLHVASSWGHLDVVRILLKYGALTCQKNAAGNTAIHLAAMGDHGDVIRELLTQYRWTTEIRQAAGRTALHLAVSMRNKKATEALVACGADPFEKDPKRKCSVLDSVILQNDPETFRIIIENMDKSKLDYSDILYRAICVYRVGDTFVKAMSNLGFDVNDRDRYGRCLLRRVMLERDGGAYGYNLDLSWCVYRLLYLGVAPVCTQETHWVSSDGFRIHDVINYIELETVEGVKVLKYLLQYGYDVTEPRHGYMRVTKNRIYIPYCSNLFQLCHYLGAYDAALITVDAGVTITPYYAGLRRRPSTDKEALFLTRLSERARNPRSLQNICRNYITRRVRNYPTALAKTIEPLGLPALVRDYLTFKYM